MTSTTHLRSAAVYCRGPLLDAVQRAKLFEDAKHFVDMPMRTEPEEILQAFRDLPDEAKSDVGLLRKFVAEHFDEPGAELDVWHPTDAPVEPPFVTSGILRDPGLQQFAKALHNYWPALLRTTSSAMKASPQRSSALPRDYPVVLPGGRFRETYYWDSLWIVHGLLVSGMHSVAKGLVQNLLDDIDKFGFVPNGGRVYYLNRSQPPVLHAMVAEVAKFDVHNTDAKSVRTWLDTAVRLLDREYKYWMERGPDGHAVQIGQYILNRYNARWDEPRPESYWQDVETAAGDPAVYRQLASAAESGWDFSSRWSRFGGSLTGRCEFRLEDLETNFVLPVDLNAIMYSFELHMAALWEIVDGSAPLSILSDIGPGVSVNCQSVNGRNYHAAAQKRRTAFNEIFWQGSLGRWMDVWLPADWNFASASTSNDINGSDGGRVATSMRSPTLADFAPVLWAGLAETNQVAVCLESLKASKLVGEAGIATTVLDTGEQWDAPNAWPPLQSMLIHGLRQQGGEARTLAFELSQRWVSTCYAAWKSTGFMHEKYSSTHFGQGGSGGEYEPQVGFGWSNGVVLQLLQIYGEDLVPV